jgi:tetratricopeptide (TPR) repeat protein
MRSSHLCSLPLAVMFLTTASAAQQTTTSTSTSGGTTSITVRVTYQQNRQPAAGLRIELLSSSGALVGDVVDMRTTDGNGGLTFDGLGSGYYRIRVSGPDVETTTSNVIAAGGAIGPKRITENMQVWLTAAGSKVEGSTVTANIPEAAQKEFKLGSKEMDKKHWEEAKDHFQKAITLFPKYVEALNSLGLVEIQLKDGEGAVKAFRSATQIDPSLPRANLYLGQFYYDNHQYKEAEPYFLRSAADQPRSAQILTALAYVELQNGETELALANARRVTALPDHKDYAISHLYAAQALAGRGKDDEIAKEYTEYLKEAPDSILAPRVKDALAQLRPK